MHRLSRYYEDVEGMAQLQRSDNIEPFVGGSKTTSKQYVLHQSPAINDCFYRNMYCFHRIAVIDFDEVSQTRVSLKNCNALRTVATY